MDKTTKQQKSPAKKAPLTQNLRSENSWDNTCGFESFGFKKNILRGIQEAGFSEPSPIQQEAIPIILDGLDVIAQAQTGTGKTAAFGLPLINNLKHNGEIEVLIVTPTRELAMQVGDEIFKLGKYGKVRTVSLFGGQPIRRQLELLEKRPQIIIATPGRLLDHLRNERLKNFSPSVVVLDESDEMLDMGFLDDIEEIFTYLSNARQTLLFSATMPTPIKHLAQKILNNPKLIKVTPEDATNQDISQRYYIINESEREDAIVRLIDSEIPSKAIIFTRMKKEADILSERLLSRGYKAGALHGDMEQRERVKSINAFKDSSINILVATDIAARGLDISGVSHVFNFHIPLNPESYVHRIGRTGRAGKKGIAITLATPLEFKEIRRIKENTKASIELYEIPSIQDTMDKQDSNLLDKILKHPISDDALRIYEQIRSHTDITQLVCKLLSMVLQDSKVLGPNKIGLDKKDLKNLQIQLENGGRKKPTINNRKNERSERKNKNKNGSKENKHPRFQKSSKENDWNFQESHKESSKKSQSKKSTQYAQNFKSKLQIKKHQKSKQEMTMEFQPYPFEKLNSLICGIQTSGERISLTIGEPQFNTPKNICEILRQKVEFLNKYPKTAGEGFLKDSMLNFLARRFNVALNPNELIPTFGTREVLFNFPQFYLFDKKNPILAHPNPFYQIYEGAAIASRAKSIYMNLTPQNGFKPSLTKEQMQDCDLVILNSPNNPTGATLSLEELKQWVEYALEYDFLLLNDECYSEIYSISKPTSILQACLEIGNERFKNVLALNSISKRSSAPGLRSGFIAGDSNILKPYLQYRTYVGCASPLPLQYAAAFAWSEDSHTESSRAQYAKNLQLAKEILGAKIPNLRVPNETFYVWLPVQNDLEWTKNLLMKENILVLPGSFLSRKNNKGENPGENFVRLALVYEESILKDALLRLQKWL